MVVRAPRGVRANGVRSIRGGRPRMRSATTSAVEGSWSPARLCPVATKRFSQSGRSADRGPRVDAPGPETCPGPLDLGLDQSGAEEQGLGEEVADRPGVGRVSKPTSSSLGADEDEAVVAGDEVVLAVLDNPAQEPPVAAEQHDLTLERRRGDADADRLQQAAPDHAPAATTTAAGDHLGFHPQPDDPAALPLEAEQGVCGRSVTPRSSREARRAFRWRGCGSGRSGRK